MDRASALADRIRNVPTRIEAIGSVARAQAEKANKTEVRLALARVQVEVDRINDRAQQADLLLQLGRSLANVGIETEPANTFARVTRLMEDEDNPGTKSQIAARLAVAHLEDGDRSEAKLRFEQALGIAGNIPAHADRLVAFTRLAPRYHDARNTTLAQKILTDAQRLAVEGLDVGTRAKVFAEIALAQAYVGDFDGVDLSVSNTGHLKAQDQIYGKLAEQLIELGRPYMAGAMLGRVTEPGVNAKLRFRLITLLVHKGDTAGAGQQLATGESMANGIDDLSQRAVVLAQFARLYSRLGNGRARDRLFGESERIVERLEGKKGDISRGSVAVDMARAELISRGRNLVAGINNPLIRDPLDSEVLAVRRVIENYVNY